MVAGIFRSVKRQVTPYLGMTLRSLCAGDENNESKARVNLAGFDLFMAELHESQRSSSERALGDILYVRREMPRACNLPQGRFRQRAPLRLEHAPALER
jgi:hypothetical protein